MIKSEKEFINQRFTPKKFVRLLRAAGTTYNVSCLCFLQGRTRTPAKHMFAGVPHLENMRHAGEQARMKKNRFNVGTILVCLEAHRNDYEKYRTAEPSDWHSASASMRTTFRGVTMRMSPSFGSATRAPCSLLPLPNRLRTYPVGL